MSDDFAPNWEQNQVLTWSGKWHVLAAIYPGKGYVPESARAACGAYGYTRDTVPKYVARLQAIATGLKPAPVCKKCVRSAGGAA